MVGLRIADYADLLAHDAAAKRALSGYTAAFMHMMVELLRYTRAGDQIDIVAERQDRYGEAALVSAKALRGLYPHLQGGEFDPAKLGEVSYAEPTQTAHFEPADLYACAVAHREIAPDSERALLLAPVLRAEGPEAFARILTREEARWAVENTLQFVADREGRGGRPSRSPA